MLIKNKVIFIIKYLGNKKVSEKEYINIIDGSGKGALDYVSSEELLQIVTDTDKLGYSNYTTTITVDDQEEEEIFDYRDFDLEDNNFLTNCNFKYIKEDYEKITLRDILRIMKDRVAMFYKTDINSIVSPFDYIKKYIPHNYNDLSEEEMDKLNIPSYEELNIYQLPSYEEINHKYIMTKYVKENIDEKENRQELFYALRNHKYMDKFYEILRKYGLFNDYKYYSDFYYENIIKDWKIKNKIKDNKAKD